MPRRRASQATFTAVGAEERGTLKRQLDEAALRLSALVRSSGMGRDFDKIRDEAATLAATAAVLGYEELERAARAVIVHARSSASDRLHELEQRLESLRAGHTESLAPLAVAGWLILMPNNPGAAKALANAIALEGQSAELVTSDEDAISALSIERRLDAILVDSGNHEELLAWLRDSLPLPPRIIEVHEGPYTPARNSCDESYDVRTGTARLAKTLTSRLAATSRAQVLALSDDSDFRAELPKALEPARLEVITLDHPDLLESSLINGQPDLLLLDADLSGFDAPNFLRQLRTKPEWRHLPVIVLTRRGGAKSRLRFFQLGAKDVVAKPTHPTELRVRVEACLERLAAESLGVERALGAGLVPAHTFERVLQRHLSMASQPTSVGVIGATAAAVADTGVARALARMLRPSELAGYLGEGYVAFFAGGPSREILPLVRQTLKDAGLKLGVGVVDSEQHPNATPATLISAARFMLPGRKRLSRPDGYDAPTVLIADHDAEARSLLARLLVHQKYRVEEASDGKEALERLTDGRGSTVDLLIMEVHMPRMDGFDVLRTLEAQQLGVRVLVLSAQGRDADIVRTLATGAEFVSKPFSTTMLLARIGRLLDQA